MKFEAPRPRTKSASLNKGGAKTHKTSLKGLPPVTPERKKQMQAAARDPQGAKRYPKMVDA